MGSCLSEHDEVFQRLTDAYHAVSQGPNSSPKAKNQLKNAALELIASLQTPHEAAMSFATQNVVHPCYRIAADCGIFTHMTKETSAKELALKTGADHRLIGLSLH